MANLAEAAQAVTKTVKSSPQELLQKPKGLAGAGTALIALPYALKGLSKLTGGDDDSNGRAAPGHGRGRRMPIQQAVDVAVPLKAAYNQWTQFEDWPRFMHRIESVGWEFAVIAQRDGVVAAEIEAAGLTDLLPVYPTKHDARAALRYR